MKLMYLILLLAFIIGCGPKEESSVLTPSKERPAVNDRSNGVVCRNEHLKAELSNHIEQLVSQYADIHVAKYDLEESEFLKGVFIGKKLNTWKLEIRELIKSKYLSNISELLEHPQDINEFIKKVFEC